MLPNNTYYKDGALINGNASLLKRISKLEEKVKILMEELNNVNNKLTKLSNSKADKQT